MYVRVRGIDFTFIYDFLLDFVIVPTVGYLLAFFHYAIVLFIIYQANFIICLS
jgi:hypothetical protein